MKAKISLLVLSLILFSVETFSQNNEIIRPDLLKTELDTISSQQLQIKSITIDNNGNWIIIYGDIGYSYISTTGEASAMLDTLASNELIINDIDFFNNNKCLILFQENGYYGDSIPVDFLQVVKSVNEKGKVIKCADIEEDKQVFIYDVNSFFEKNAPQMFITRMRALQNRNQNIKQAAFLGEKAWIILYAQKGMIYQYLPAELSEKLITLGKQDVTIDKIFFLKDKWIIIYDNYKYLSNL